MRAVAEMSAKFEGTSTVDFMDLLKSEQNRQSDDAVDEELMPRSEGFIPADRGHTGKQGWHESWEDYIKRLDNEYTE